MNGIMIFGAPLVLLALPATASNATPLATIVIKPSAMSEAEGGTIDIDMTLPSFKPKLGAPLLSLELKQIGAVALQPVSNLVVTDARGSVPIVADKAKPGTWTASRPTNGTLRVRYRLPLANIDLVAGGPPLNLRIDGAGFSGAGANLIMAPATADRYRVALKWDLSAMPRGAGAVSSFGKGDVILPADTFDRFGPTFYMAGPIKQFPADGQGVFRSAWTGQPAFDPTDTMSWTSKLHRWMSAFFKSGAAAPYTVFLRYNPVNAGGGVALRQSFVATYGAGVTGEGLKSVLSHEMIHTWTAWADLGDWYTEGNAVYYQMLLPWRAGLASPDQFLADFNDTARRYYSNALNDTDDAEIEPRFWEDTRIRVLPYDRGAIYFVILNDKIRKASKGRRSVDDLIQTMIERRRADQATDESVWLNLIRAEIGEEGIVLHRAMKAGKLLLPESDAFGPCFRRVTGKARRFELGFDPKSLVGDKRVIKGLIPGSEAAKAGLQNGDAVRYRVALDIVQSDQHKRFELAVTRDGKTFPLSYLPRGETVDVYQWARTGVPNHACRY